MCRGHCAGEGVCAWEGGGEGGVRRGVKRGVVTRGVSVCRGRVCVCEKGGRLRR